MFWSSDTKALWIKESSTWIKGHLVKTPETIHMPLSTLLLVFTTLPYSPCHHGGSSYINSFSWAEGKYVSLLGFFLSVSFQSRVWLFSYFSPYQVFQLMVCVMRRLFLAIPYASSIWGVVSISFCSIFFPGGMSSCSRYPFIILSFVPSSSYSSFTLSQGMFGIYWK